MSEVQRFRKKPVVIEAMLFDGGYDDMVRAHEFMDWETPVTVTGDNETVPFFGYIYPRSLFIPTLEGEMTCSPGDWIIKGVKGEFYPCKPDIFDATYGAVEL